MIRIFSNRGQIRRLLIAVGAGCGFFITSVILFMYWTFPYDRVADFIVQEVEHPRGPGGERRASGYELEIVSLSPSWLTGVELTGVRLSKVPTTPDAPPVEVTFERVLVRVSLWSLIQGDVGVSFEVEVAGGALEGEYEQTDETVHLEAKIESVDLRQIGVIRSLIGLPVAGTLGGTVDVTLERERPRDPTATPQPPSTPAEERPETTGNVNLTIAGLAIGDGQAKFVPTGMRDGIRIARINAGDLRLRLSVRNGTAQIEELAARTSHIDLQGAGTIRLREAIANSIVDVMLRFKFGDEYRNQNELTRTMFLLMDVLPEVQSARTPDGFLQFRFSGVLSQTPRPSPAGRAAMPSRRAQDPQRD